MRDRAVWMALGLAMVALGTMTGVGGAEEAAAPAPGAAPVPAPAPRPPAEQVLLDDELPAGATSDGAWVWDTQAASGTKSHGHPPAAGLQQHAVTFAAPITVPKSGEVVTSVWLDPANPPKGVMITFTLAGGEETGVYWEGEEEVFNPGEDEEIWYYGLLPEFGVWTPLAVAAEDLGIEDAAVKTITFVTHGGRVLWDRTVVQPMADLAPPGSSPTP